MDLKKMWTADKAEKTEEVYERPRIVEKSHQNLLIRTPKSFDDAQEYADAILKGSAIVLNFEAVDDVLRNQIFDYLNGVSYVVDAHVSIIGEGVLLYAPRQLSVDKKTGKLGRS